jgi:hypothetical protein
MPKINSIHSLLTHTSARKFVSFLDVFQCFIQQEQTLHDDKRANHSENFSCHELRKMLIGQSSSAPYLTFGKVHVVVRLGKARAAEGLTLSEVSRLALGTSTPFVFAGLLFGS